MGFVPVLSGYGVGKCVLRVSQSGLGWVSGGFRLVQGWLRVGPGGFRAGIGCFSAGKGWI